MNHHPVENPADQQRFEHRLDQFAEPLDGHHALEAGNRIELLEIQRQRLGRKYPAPHERG